MEEGIGQDFPIIFKFETLKKWPDNMNKNRHDLCIELLLGTTMNEEETSTTTAANNNTNFWLQGELLKPDETNYSETNFGDASKRIYQTASST